MQDEVYDQIAALERTHWWFVARRAILRSLIDRFLPPAPNGTRPRLCDIGCGAGELLRVMAGRFDVTGIDSSPRAREICAKSGITIHDGLLPDGLPFSANSFDVIIAADVLEHVPDDTASVRSIARLLRPGGIAVITVPAYAWLWSKHDTAAHHIRRYTKGSLRRLFEPAPPEAPLKRELLSYFNTLLLPPIAATRLLGRLRPGTAGSDIHPTREPLNGFLRRIFQLERHLLPTIPLPAGVSLIAVYRRA